MVAKLLKNEKGGILKTLTTVILANLVCDKNAFLSVDEYTELVARRDLYKLLDEGLNDISVGKTQDFIEAMKEIRREASNG